MYAITSPDFTHSRPPIPRAFSRMVPYRYYILWPYRAFVEPPEPVLLLG